jgi:photosystem II stability/assembly factor-like uncharacterized protein
VIFASTAAGVFRSDDAGSHWLLTNPAITEGVLAVDPQDSSRLYSSGPHDEVLRSTDGGFRWAHADVGLTLAVGSPNVDPHDPLTVFATVGGGVAKTTDGGAHWSILSSGLPARPGVKVVVVDPQNSAMLYATTDFPGVFRSEDAGAKWTRLGSYEGRCARLLFPLAHAAAGTLGVSFLPFVIILAMAGSAQAAELCQISERQLRRMIQDDGTVDYLPL